MDSAHNGTDALSRFRQTRPDLVLLDLMLPGMDGLQVCREIRRESQVPVLMLTAKGEEVDKVVGLEVGADDYVTKPFSVRELVARVRALLRRARMNKDDPLETTVTGELVLDQKAYTLTKRGQPVALTHREFGLARYLIVRPLEVFNRETLLGEIWGYDFSGDVRTVDVAIRRIREKLEDEPARPRYIRTRRGVGYYFDPGKPTST